MGIAAAAVGVASALALSACSGGSDTLARQACTKVRTALADQAESAGASPSRALALRKDAVDELEAAEPLAGQAAGQSGNWEALQATLSEAGQVPVKYLVHALSAECSSDGDEG